jgi:hypothetical protein
MMEWVVFVRTGICIGILGTRKELRLQVEMSSKSSGVEFHAVQVRVMRRQLAPQQTLVPNPYKSSGRSIYDGINMNFGSRSRKNIGERVKNVIL